MILIVDDDPTSVRLLEMTLRRAALRYLTARSGAEALDVLDREAGIDLVLTDYKMPGMNGVDLATRIRATANGRTVPIVMLTSQADRDTVAGAVQAGVIDFIAKPIDPGVVLRRVRRALAHGLPTIGSRNETRDRLRLSESEYVELARTTLAHVEALAGDLQLANESGDQDAINDVAARIVESASLFGSDRCLFAIRMVRAASGTARTRAATLLLAALLDYEVALAGATAQPAA